MKRHWKDLTSREQAVVLALASVQLSLAATAWADLATRPAREVNGKKAVWAVVIGVNFIGPIAYLGWGRAAGRRDSAPFPATSRC